MKKTLPFVLSFLVAVATQAAVPFTAGDIAVYRVSNGATALGTAATAVFIDEYTPTGTFVQSIAVPASGASSLTDSGTASSDGELTLSTNGQFLVFGGYGADAGTTGVVGSTAARVVGALDVTTGSVDTTTRLTSASTYTGNNFRGVASQDGTSFWLAGTGSGSSNGVRYATLGATTSINIESNITNTRGVGIFNSQLYMSSAPGIYSVGSGVPTTTGQSATLLPPGSEFTGSVSYTGFYLTPDGTRLFAANGGASNSIQEFVLNAGNWSLNQSFNVAGSFQLTGTTTGNLTRLFYTLNSGTAANTLNSVTFDGGTNTFGTASLLATAATNDSFKGVAFVAPVPELSTVLYLIGGLGLLIAGRRSIRCG